MTLLTDFDIATDLKVEFYIPNVSLNAFIIGVSELGGSNVLPIAGVFFVGSSLLGSSDVLGGSGFDWQDLGCETSVLRSELGGQVENVTYFQPQSAEALIQLQSYSYDPTNNRTVRPGTPIRARVSRGDVDQILFRGYLDTIDVSYTVDGPNLITIKAYDSFKRVMNTRLATFDTTSGFPGYATPLEVAEKIAVGFGTTMNALSAATIGRIPSDSQTDVIPNTLLNEAIKVGLAFFWIDPVTEEFVFIPRPTTAAAPGGTYTIGNSHEDSFHLCMSDLSVAADSDDVYNSLRVSLESDSATYVIREDVASIELYGTAAIDVSINTTDSDQLNIWADKVFTQSPTRLVQSVQTPAVDRSGNLTHAAAIYPGEVVGVKYETTDMDIDTYYSVTKVSHSIDVNNWFTTLELWKEV